MSDAGRKSLEMFLISQNSLSFARASGLPASFMLGTDSDQWIQFDNLILDLVRKQCTNKHIGNL